MSRNLVKPFFAVPPDQYDRSYFANLVRSFAVYLDQIQNPGEGRNTFIVLTALQTDDVGLEPGALFQSGGFVKVTEQFSPHVRGSAVTVSVGSVTVATS
jgi:hypothetical protein